MCSYHFTFYDPSQYVSSSKTKLEMGWPCIRGGMYGVHTANGTPPGSIFGAGYESRRLLRGDRCLAGATEQGCLLITAVKPGIYGLAFTMGKWSLTDNSATVGRVLMISSADPHEF